MGAWRVHADAVSAMKQPEPLRGITVLLVDDNTDSREVFSRYLTHFGAQVVDVPDPAAALALLQRMRFDVIVSDLSMPGMSGIDFLTAVRRLPSERERLTPAIAYTAYDTYRAAALRAGFAVYLIKPIDPPVFVDEVARLARPAGP